MISTRCGILATMPRTDGRVFQFPGLVHLVQAQTDQRLRAGSAGRRIGLPICLTTIVFAIVAQAVTRRWPLRAAASTGASTTSRTGRMSETFLPRRAATMRGLASHGQDHRTSHEPCCRGSVTPIDLATTSWIAQHLEHGAHRTTCDDPGPLAGAVRIIDLARAPTVRRRHGAACGLRAAAHGSCWRLACFRCLADRLGDFLGLALEPKPTRPFWSPTTTSAAKPKRLPPFTVLETRLIATRRSANSGVSSSRSRRPRPRPRPPSRLSRSAIVASLEFQARPRGRHRPEP